MKKLLPIGLLVGLSVLGWFAWQDQQQAVREREAEREAASRALAEEQRRLADDRARRAQVAAEAEAEEAARRAALAEQKAREAEAARREALAKQWREQGVQGFPRLVHAKYAIGNQRPGLPIQSPARPYSLEIFSPVEAAGGDERAVQFQQDVLPSVVEYAKTYLAETTQENINYNPDDFFLAHDADVRVYFIGEGAGYHNSIGINTGDGELVEGEEALIFPDASTAHSWLNTDDTKISMTNEQTPLLPGDYVDIGEVEGGTLLDFFMVQDGAGDEPGEIFGIEAEENVDGLPHVVVHAVVDDSIILVGFEDLTGGGDMDYEDTLIAVDIGEENVKDLIARNPTFAPEAESRSITPNMLFQNPAFVTPAGEITSR